MKKIILILSFFAIHNYVDSQTCKLNIDLKELPKITSQKIRIYIQYFDQDSILEYKDFLDINDVKTTMVKYNKKVEKSLLSIVNLYIGDSLVIGSNVLLSNTLINIKYIKKINSLKIDGGGNEFYNKNKLLLFDIPESIYREKEFDFSLYNKASIIKSENYGLQYKIYEFENNIIETVKLHKSNFFVLHKVYEQKNNISNKTLETCCNILKKSFADYYIFKDLVSFIEKRKTVFIGNAMPNIIIKDSVFGFVNLKAFLNPNKMYIINCWASWCKLCRLEMKDIKEIYAKIDTSKVQIISIGLDINDIKNFNAKAKDGISWLTFNDNRGFSSDIAKTFSLPAIPYNIFLTSQQTILYYDSGSNSIIEFLKSNNLLVP